MTRDVLLSLQQLHRRGWSKGMIRRFLGPPDAQRSNPHNPAGPGLRLYDVMRVRAIETTGAFQEAKAIRKRRSQAGRAAAKTRRENLRRRADRLKVEVEIIDYSELMARAVAWSNAQQQRQALRLPGFEPLLASVESDRDVLIDIAGRYAASVLAKFDRDLEREAARSGDAEVIGKISRAVRSAVVGAYPQLGGDD